MAHALAVFDADHLVHAIDDHSKHPADRFPPKLQIEQFKTMTARHTDGGLSHAFDGCVAGNTHNRSDQLPREKRALKTRKVGTGPLTTAFPAQPYRVYTQNPGPWVRRCVGSRCCALRRAS